MLRIIRLKKESLQHEQTSC